MRVLAAAIVLAFIATPAPAASPQVEAVVKLLQGIGKDPQRLARFCKLMNVVEETPDRKALNAAMDELNDKCPD